MHNILLVDDNKYVLEALALILSSYTDGCRILKAEDGRVAADILDRLPVAVVLTDIQMPVMNGFKLIDYRNQFHPSIPLLVMTSNPSPEVLEKLRSLGITHCIEKPFDYEVVTRLILKNLLPRPSLATPREDTARPATV